MTAASADSPRNLSVRDGLVIACALLVSVGAALVSLPTGGRDRSRASVIVFAPWIAPEQSAGAAIAAGHRILRNGIWPFVLVVAPGAEGEAAPLRPDGTVLMLDLDGLAGCLDSRSSGALAS